MDDKRYRAVLTAEDVTDEILQAATDIVDGWYSSGPVDWADFLDRLDGKQLNSGERIDLGDSMLSLAITKIKAHVRAYRKS